MPRRDTLPAGLKGNMKKKEMRKRLKAALSLMGRYEGRCLKLEKSVKSLDMLERQMARAYDELVGWTGIIEQQDGYIIKLRNRVKSLEEHAALVEGSFGAWANETYKIKDRVKVLEAAQAKPEPFTQSIDPIFFNGKWWVETEPPTFRWGLDPPGQG